MHSLYYEDIEYISKTLDCSKLKNKIIMISGASGLIGSCVIDTIMYMNEKYDLQCKIIALGRNLEAAKKRFEKYFDNPTFQFIQMDINQSIEKDFDKIDYIFHLASNTHPKAYALDPVGTIHTNIIGTNNLLEIAKKSSCERFIFASSCEIYGEAKDGKIGFDESYCGYIDCNTLRAGYNESKRCGEALCQAYIKQYGLDIVIPRIARCYGATLLSTDTKALTQFINNAITGENIVLKSEGKQYFSYVYVADVVSALFKILLNGKCGEAYNISNDESNITLKELAQLIANECGSEVVFDLPSEIEKAGFSKATIAILKNDKLCTLGWKPNYSIQEGIRRTIKILKDEKK